MVEEFEVDRTEGDGPGEPPSGLQPDYNVAPTKVAPVVLQRRPRQRADTGTDSGTDSGTDTDTSNDTGTDGGSGSVSTAEPEGDAAAEAPRWLRLLTWGLVPSWAKDRSGASRMINARVEGLLEKPAYRRAALARRCLVPADGWYEWQASPVARDRRGKPVKQPFFLRGADGEPVAFAGVYEFWRDRSVAPDGADAERATGGAGPAGAWLTTFSIVTAPAEPGLDAIHDRMPFVMPRQRWAAWLDPDLTEPDAVRGLLRPPPPGRFEAVPVTTRVNGVDNNGPELLDPAPLESLHGVVDPATGQVLGWDGIAAPRSGGDPAVLF